MAVSQKRNSYNRSKIEEQMRSRTNRNYSKYSFSKNSEW